jgi:serine/threonine protein kinase
MLPAIHAWPLAACSICLLHTQLPSSPTPSSAALPYIPKSTQLFMAGRVSKASDVYAFGMLLYELASGQRAFTGVPLPLLPHEVAVKGLRPTWPQDLPPAFGPLRRLAQACWAQDPDHRYVLTWEVQPGDVCAAAPW